MISPVLALIANGPSAPDGLGLADSLADSDKDGETDTESDSLTLGETDSLRLGDIDSDADSEAEGLPAATNTIGGSPAVTYTVFTPAVGDCPLFFATGRPAVM